jgi:hypothetical protein
VNAEDWLRERLPGLTVLEKGDSSTRVWRTESLFVKFFPYALQERAAIEADQASSSERQE